MYPSMLGQILEAWWTSMQSFAQSHTMHFLSDHLRPAADVLPAQLHACPTLLPLLS